MFCMTGVYLRTCSHFPGIEQKVNQRLLNSYYRHKVAATDHSRQPSDRIIWSLGTQAVFTIGQFLGIWMPFFGCATSIKSTFKLKGLTSKDQHFQKPVLFP